MYSVNLSYLSFKKFGIYPARGFDYLTMCVDANLLTLEERRICASILLISSILCNEIECPKLLEQIPILVPHRSLRSDQPFYPPRNKSNFSLSSPINRLIKACNFIVQQSNNIDLLDFASRTSASALATIIVNSRQTDYLSLASTSTNNN